MLCRPVSRYSTVQQLRGMTKTQLKEVRKTCARRVPGDGRFRFTCFALVIALVVGGCAGKQSKSTSTEPPPADPGSGIAEYRQLTKEALAALRGTLNSLDSVITRSNPCPPKLITAFSEKVQRLQVDSLRIRARGQAIQARGDAYFADWSQSIARIKDAKVRAAAEHFRPQLEQSFKNIKAASQQAGGEFSPFLHGVRMLRLEFEKHSGFSREAATQDLVRATREHGELVIHQLTTIQGELQNITDMLTSGEPPVTRPS